MKILEQKGIEITNIDGAVFNNFTSGGKDGILKGVLNECKVYLPASNIVAISTGEMLVQGIRIQLTEEQTFSFSATPSLPIRYQVVVRVVRQQEDVSVEFQLRPIQALEQQNLYKTDSGVYEAEVIRFTQMSSGSLEDVTRTMDIISGSTSSGGSNPLSIGEVETNTLESGMEAEVDLEIVEKEGIPVLNASFSIPKGVQGIQGIQGKTGAKLVSQTLIGQDENGGNIYLQTFDDGTTATFVAPQGKQGESGGVTGVKGNAETSYRVGNVNITPANIGALVKDDLKTNVYPVGSIYMSTNSTSPASFLGGSWTRIYGQFLLGAGTTPNTSKSYTAGTTGGSADAVVVSHTHKINYLYGGTGGVTSDGTTVQYGYAGETYGGITTTQNKSTLTTVGESGTGKNMPPYLVVYMWKRTA